MPATSAAVSSLLLQWVAWWRSLHRPVLASCHMKLQEHVCTCIGPSNQHQQGFAPSRLQVPQMHDGG